MGARTISRKCAGFTAVELMVVVAIVAILTVMAAPYMGDMVRTQRLRSASFDVFSSLTMARSEAIKRNTTVTMAPAGGSWLNGWSITDTNGNVVKNQDAFEGLVINGPGSVTYTGSGRLSAAVAPFSLAATPSSGVTMYRCVSVDLSGRPVSTEAPC
ncbi:MAG TPA: GspH/FimT family pseudopilin [Usitatibacter sp.]|nr:GspH/FimT family pseudopilin [Usitatibacter sp.]